MDLATAFIKIGTISEIVQLVKGLKTLSKNHNKPSPILIVKGARACQNSLKALLIFGNLYY